MAKLFEQSILHTSDNETIVLFPDEIEEANNQKTGLGIAILGTGDAKFQYSFNKKSDIEKGTENVIWQDWDLGLISTPDKVQDFTAANITAVKCITSNTSTKTYFNIKVTD